MSRKVNAMIAGAVLGGLVAAVKNKDKVPEGVAVGALFGLAMADSEEALSLLGLKKPRKQLKVMTEEEYNEIKEEDE